MQARTRWLIAILFGLGTAVSFVYITAETLWFRELHYEQVFGLRLKTQVAIWTIVTAVSSLFLLGNLALARRLKYPRQQSDSPLPTPHSPLPTPHSLPSLLPLTLGLSLLIGILLWHYSQVALHLWSLQQTDTSWVLPDRFRPESVGQLVRLLTPQAQAGFYWTVGIGLAGAIALLLFPIPLLTGIAVAIAPGLGLILSTQWGRVLQRFHAVSFDRPDPLFSRDVGFYVFSLPMWELLEFWLVGLFLYGLLAVALIYLLSGDSLSQGRFIGLNRLQKRHLSGLGGCLMLAVSLSYWISRYELLYSSRGVAYGASYTDIKVQLPACIGLSALAGAIALWLLGNACFSRPKSSRNNLRSHRPSNSKRFDQPSIALLLLGAYGTIALTTTYILPAVIQRLVVQPNELAREQPFIQRSIALTREAFALDAVDVEIFDPRQNLTISDIQENNLTIRNVRLWDTRPLLETNRQLQQIRPYYRFFDADIDRYSLMGEDPSNPIAQTAEKQQVLIAARELDYNAVPLAAKTWVNEHLVYTHGYGFTVSPVNKVGPGGLPDYFVKDIGVDTSNAGGNLNATSGIRSSIPTQNPRIYYGEGTDTYVMTRTRVQELDYPSGNDNVYNTYDGTGGVAIGSLGQRGLFACYLKDWQMLLTNNFTPQTKLLFRRNINQRIRAIAPFLRYDQDPYLVVADAGAGNPHYLYWMVDAYTTSDRYPYSEPSHAANKAAASQELQASTQGNFNYIRNSVKVVIDANNGSVDFYIADPKDPMIQTWSAIFPGLFKPLSQMPAALRSHIRYPADLFSIQAERLMTYHMTDPQVFYNREDTWQVPTEIYGTQPRLVEPYYLIIKLPTAASEEFVLLLPFTPNQRNNLTAWLAARSDDSNYGRSLLYLFPKQQLVYGIEQIEARINQDPVISQQISLWNRQGSRALQGNLLVIPIEQSLLYVEPLYLEAEQNSLPTLIRVIVAYENRIVMAETLEQALQAVFQPQKPAAPAIVRPVE